MKLLCIQSKGVSFTKGRRYEVHETIDPNKFGVVNNRARLEFLTKEQLETYFEVSNKRSN